jgi:hypothetical protein
MLPSWLLSYANGGYIQPLYVAGHQLDPNSSDQVPCAIALASQTTSLERLGTSWVVPNSDLKVYLGCLPVLERMMKDSYWQEAFDFIVAQYFQAVQPGIVAWQVRAIAVNAALERVSYTILVKDLKEERDEEKKRHNELLFKKNYGEDLKNYTTHWQTSKYSYKGSNSKKCYYSQTVIRLSLLLESVGLEESKDLNLIQDFVGVRNDAVHPISRHDSMTKENREKLIHQATQWLDEVLLWRLGYYGAYLDRFKKVGFATEPRYDLKARDSSW